MSAIMPFAAWPQRRIGGGKLTSCFEALFCATNAKRNHPFGGCRKSSRCFSNANFENCHKFVPEALTEVGQPSSGDCDKWRRLTLAKVVTHRLPRRGFLTKNSEEIVAKLECGPERQPNCGQRCTKIIKAVRQCRAEVQRAFNGVLRGFIPRDPMGERKIRIAVRRSEQIQRLPDAEFEAKFIP